MKIAFDQSGADRSVRAFTLPEMVISMTIFGMLVMGLVAVNIFVLRQDELVNSKLGANDMTRLAFDLMLNEIRGGKSIQIGSGSYTNFVAVTNGSVQGNTIKIVPSTNLYPLIYYYIDTNSADTNFYNCLLRAFANTNGSTTNPVYTVNIICSNLTNMSTTWATNVSMFQGSTNALLFQAFDYTGTNLLTVDPATYTNYNYVVGFLLQFSQLQYPLTKVGGNNFFNYYQIQFQAVRRCPTI